MSESAFERGRREDEVEETADAPQAKQSEQVDDGFDDLLDEIDGVLETDAEDFVRSFVQKGGQ